MRNLKLDYQFLHEVMQFNQEVNEALNPHSSIEENKDSLLRQLLILRYFLEEHYPDEDED